MWRSWGRYAAALAVIAIVLWFPIVREGRVPLLWAADLGFHELGHLVAIPLGRTAHFLAGSLTQVAVPLGLGVYFWYRQRDHAATGLMLAWAASAAYDTAVYIADAPFQRLPLIGGHHDWAFLLNRWGALDQADAIATAVRLGGLIVGLAGILICAAPLFDGLRRRFRANRKRAGGSAEFVREIRWRGHR